MSAHRIVDAHHHIWRLDKTPWLNGPQVPRIFGEYGAIRRDYLVDEFAAEAKAEGITESVYVQINVAPGEEIEEVEYATTEGIRAGLIQRVVAFADLCSPTVGDVLDAQSQYGTLRGVRQQLHWHQNPAYRFASTPDRMLEPDFQRGLEAVERRDLHFELQVFVDQIEPGLRLIEAFPNVRFVVLHAGMIEDTSDEGWAYWLKQMSALATQDNVLIKLSGLGTFTHRCTVKDWRPIVARTVELFGPDRCMFGSNFPVEKLWTSYHNLIQVFNTCIADLSSDEQHAILSGTASSLYQINTDT